MLQVQSLTSTRGGRQLFANLTFSLAAGECLHLQGPNGVGKTTLLKALAGLTTNQGDAIRWQGRTQAEWGDEFAAAVHFLGHRDALKDACSPLENLLMQSRLQGLILSETSAMQALLKVGLAACIDIPVRQLSQGQKRRAALARFVAWHRPLWIMDEPLVALDVAAQAELGRWLADHLAHGGMAILTSHQEIPAAIPEPRVLVLEAA